MERPQDYIRLLTNAMIHLKQAIAFGHDFYLEPLKIIFLKKSQESRVKGKLFRDLFLLSGFYNDGIKEIDNIIGQGWGVVGHSINFKAYKELAPLVANGGVCRRHEEDAF